MANASDTGPRDRISTPMAPARMAPTMGGDAEAAVQSAQILHPSKSEPQLEAKSFAKTRGMRWYTHLLLAAIAVAGIGLLIGTWG